MKKLLITFAGAFALFFSVSAQTTSNQIVGDQERELRQEVFISNRSIDADHIPRAVERLKMSYPEIELLEVDPVSKEVTLVYDKRISSESYREIVNYFKF